ncbi:MAG: S8 family serine peptidase [Candidatus Cloacimonetes bacterium]|jgi:subtilisin family serine protease|nr:S8 family serine peptidase [Candidatus Cloacimonadota bacterium]
MKLVMNIILIMAISISLWGMDYVPNQLIFKTTSAKQVNNKTIGLESFDNFLAERNIDNLKSILPKSDNKYFIATFPNDINWENIKNYQFEGIEYFQLNYLNEFYLQPNDPEFPDQQVHLDNCNIPESWDYTVGNEQIIVAIVDSGIHFDHPDLQNNIFINQNEIPNDGIDNDDNGYIDDVYGWDFVDAPELSSIALGDYLQQDNQPDDELNHGTHLAGIISADTNNGEGVSGISWNSKLLIIRSGFKTLDGGYLQDDDAAAGIIYAADMGADVINLSWGDINYSQIIADACYYAYNKGSIIVVAAGNEGATASHQVVYPAQLSTTLAIGAVDKYKNRALFSSYGPQLDLVAPGQLVLSTYDTTPEDLYKEQSGTSMAAPFVAGAIALLLSVEPGQDFPEIRGRLISSAHDLGDEGFDNIFGNGLLDVYSLLTNFSYPIIEITTPQDNAGLNSTFDIIGTVQCSNFWRYSVKYTSAEMPLSTDWHDVDPQNDYYFEQVDNDLIAQFIIDNYVADETYKIKIEITTLDNQHYNYFRTIHIDQTAPEFYAEYASYMKRFSAEIPEYYIQALFDEDVNIFLKQYPSTEFLPYFGEADSLQIIKIDGLPPNVLIDVKANNLCGLETIINDAYEFETDQEAIDIHGFSQTAIGNEFVSIQKNYDFDGNGNNEIFALEIEGELQTLKMLELNGEELIIKHVFSAVFWPNDMGNSNESGMEVIGIQLNRPLVLETSGETYPSQPIFVDENALGANFADYDDDGIDEVILVKNEADINGISHRVITLNQRNGDAFDRDELILNTTPTNQKNFFSTKVICDKLDNDNYPDILAADKDGDIMIFEQESGTFEMVWDYRLPVNNAYNLCSGDFTGDGLLEFCVGGYNQDASDPARSFSYYEFFKNTGTNNEYQSLGYLAFSEINTKNSIASADIDGNEDDEIVIAVPPNIYIIDYIDGQFQPIWQGLSAKTSSNVIAFSGKTASQDAFIITNIEDNGEIRSSLITEMEEFTGPISPQFFNAAPVDSVSVYLSWQHPGADNFKVYRKFENNIAMIAGNVQDNYFIDDNLTTGDTLYYQITAIDNSFDPVESLPTAWEIAVPYFAPELNNIRMISQYEIKLKFDLEVDNIFSTIFSVEFGREMIYPISVNMIEQNTALILRFNDEFGEYYDYILNISGLTGKTGVPVDQGPYQFQYEEDTFPPEIITVKASSTKMVNIIFSEALNETTVENIGNYTLLLPAVDKDNEIESLEYVEADSCYVSMHFKYELKYTNQPYFLKVNNIKDLAGNPISISGNKCHFSLTSMLGLRNLKQMIVYPNPLDISENLIDKVNFINLPPDVSGSIWIYSLDGELIFESKVGPYSINDLKPYFSWKCENNSGNRISSGIYFYLLRMGKDSRKGKIIIIN